MSTNGVCQAAILLSNKTFFSEESNKKERRADLTRTTLIPLAGLQGGERNGYKKTNNANKKGCVLCIGTYKTFFLWR